MKVNFDTENLLKNQPKPVNKFSKVSGNYWKNFVSGFKAKFKKMPCLQVLANPIINFVGLANKKVLCDCLTVNNILNNDLELFIEADGNIQIPIDVAKIWNIRVFDNTNFACCFPVAEGAGNKIWSTNSNVANISGFSWQSQDFYNGLNELGFVKTTDDIQIVFANGEAPQLSLPVYAKNLKSIHSKVNYGWNTSKAKLDFNTCDDYELGDELNPDYKFENRNLWNLPSDNLFRIDFGKAVFSGSNTVDAVSTIYASSYFPKGLYRYSFKIKQLSSQPANIAIGWSGYRTYHSGVYAFEAKNVENINVFFIKAMNSGSFEISNVSVKPVIVSPQTKPAELMIFNKLAYTGNTFGYPEVFKPSITETMFFETENPYLWDFEEFCYEYLGMHLNPEFKKSIVFQMFDNGFNCLETYTGNIESEKFKNVISKLNKKTKQKIKELNYEQ